MLIRKLRDSGHIDPPNFVQILFYRCEKFLAMSDNIPPVRLPTSLKVEVPFCIYLDTTSTVSPAKYLALPIVDSRSDVCAGVP